MSPSEATTLAGREGSERTPARWLLVVFLVALFVRVPYFLERHRSADLRQPTVDAGFHDDWARTLAFGSEHAGEWRAEHLGDPHFGTSPYLRPPGFPYLLALVYRLSGGSHLAAIAVQMLLGLGSVLLVFSLLQRTTGGGPALLGGLLMGTLWTPLYFEGELHATALLIALQLGFVTCLLRFLGRWRLAALVGAGILLGAATLTRPNALAYLPAACIWLVGVCRWRGKPWIRPVAVLSAITLLTLVPAYLRNGIRSGQWVPITTNFGINLYLGNHAGADGLIRSDPPGVATFKTCYDYPSLILRLEEELGPGATQRDVSQWFSDQAWAWILEDPAGFLRLSWRKLRWLVGPAEVGHNKEVALERRASRTLAWLPMPFPWLLALALGGLLVQRAIQLNPKEVRGAGSQAPVTGHVTGQVTGRELLGLVLLLVLAYGLSLLPFFAAARYRIPLLPWLVILAAPLAGLRSLSAGAALRAIVPAVGLGIIATLGGPSVSQSGEKWHVERAIALAMAERPQEARVELELALAVNPRSTRALYELALLDHAEGKHSQARQRYELVVRTDPDHHLAQFNLGTILRSEQDFDGALRCFRAAEQAAPMFAPAAYNQGLLFLRAGKLNQASACIERAVSIEQPATRILSEAIPLIRRTVTVGREAGLDVSPLETLLQRLPSPH